MNATKVVLMLTILGLVAASGYLIYKKVRPQTDPAVASNQPGDAKPGEQPTPAASAPKTGTPTPVAKQLPGEEDLQEVPSEPLEQEEPPQQELDDEDSPGKQLPDGELTDLSEEAPARVPARQASLPNRRQMPDSQADAESEDNSELTELTSPGPKLSNGRGSETADSMPLDQPEDSADETGDPMLGSIEPAQSESQEPTLVEPEPPLAAPSPNKGATTPKLDWEAEELETKTSRRPAAKPGPEAVPEEPTELPTSDKPVRLHPELQPADTPRGRPTPADDPRARSQEMADKFAGVSPGRKLQPVPAKTDYNEDGADPASETYTVQPNDNFWKISKKVYGTARYFLALKQYNESRAPDPYNMKPGLKLATPAREVLQSRYPELIDLNPSDKAGGRKSSAVEPAGLFFSTDGEPMYRVTDDDTLGGISQKHLGRFSRWPEIYDRNKDVLPDTENLKPGMVLRLPGDASQLKVVGTP